MEDRCTFNKHSR